MLMLYNTLTRQEEPFTPITPGLVGLYSCGPTVYWFAHIGNMRAFLFADILRRTLAYNGLDVTMIMNITDVGHLQGDGDVGEDKMILAMQREGKTAYEIAEFYTQEFYADIDRLNILRADKYTKATDHIAEQIDMVKKLEANGFTYVTSDGVYFDTAKLPSYGQLSGQKAEEKKAGARVEVGEKKSPTDFALWKFSPENSTREMEWDSPWGVGFPGWHIECSAMSTKYLGNLFDIHTGGVDHIPVHHENEIAQTMGAEGTIEANVWMHSEFLTMDGGKMSKSLGNLYTMKNLVEKGFDPLAYRYFVLGAHYRTKLNFTFEALGAAQNALHRLQSLVRDWDAPAETGIADLEERFLAAVNDDLNTPQALSVLWELVDADEPTSAKATSLLKMDRVLGLGLEAYVSKALDIPEAVQALVQERESARAEKNWDDSDRLRLEIEAHGYAVEDTDAGPKIIRRH